MCSARILALKLIAVVCIFGVLQVSYSQTPLYGKNCTDFNSCQTPTEHPQCVDPLTPDPDNCYELEFKTLKTRVCPPNITTSENIPRPACVGVPEPVQNVQVSTLRDNDTISFNATWEAAAKYVGPVTYVVSVIGISADGPISSSHITIYADEDNPVAMATGLTVGWTYSIFVDSFTAVGHASIQYPVTITNAKPNLASDVLSASTNITSFNVRLCSSCLVDPSQGLLKAAAIVVCDETAPLHNCPLNMIDSARDSNLRVQKAEDINKLPTWAKSKDDFFRPPYRVTPSDFHQTLQAERTSDFLFTVGGSHCNDSDKQAYCNGPLRQDAWFRVYVVTCNDVGCVDYVTRTDGYNTKPVSDDDDDDDDDDDAAIIGLSITLGIVVLVCVGLVVYILVSRRSS